MRTWLVGLLAALWMTAASAASPAKTVVFDLQNFSCPACRITVEKALDHAPGVTARNVDAASATARVTFDPARTSEASVARAITASGFPAKARKTGG
jgi:copper chaperone CopZ